MRVRSLFVARRPVRQALAFAAALGLASAAALPAGAQTELPLEKKPKESAGLSGGTFTFQWENDKFAGTDRHYTNGIRLGWVSDDVVPELDWARDVMTWLYPFEPNPKARIGLVLGQNMFTPEDISTEDLIRDDRPYAGWLYAGLSLNAETQASFFGEPMDVLDTMELNVGVVGPQSFAEETQETVHRIINVQIPRGWGNQLSNEPGVALVVERKWRSPSLNLLGLEMDAIPSANVSLGNVDTSGTLGTLFRIGQGLKTDYGPPHIRPNLTGIPSVAEDAPDFAWYLFGGAAGRAVARNIFLDGNTFEESHSVDKHPLVGDIQVGAAVLVENVRLSFTYFHRTREFEGQDLPDRWGSVGVSFHY